MLAKALLSGANARRAGTLGQHRDPGVTSAWPHGAASVGRKRYLLVRPDIDWSSRWPTARVNEWVASSASELLPRASEPEGCFRLPASAEYQVIRLTRAVEVAGSWSMRARCNVWHVVSFEAFGECHVVTHMASDLRFRVELVRRITGRDASCRTIR